MKLLKIAANVFNVFSMIAIVVMLILVVGDVFLRFFFRAPIVGATELVRIMMICLSPSFASAVIEDRHLKVGLIVDRFKRKGQLAIDTVVHTISAVICALIAYRALDYVVVQIGRQFPEAFDKILRFPRWPFMLLFGVSLALTGIAMIVTLVFKFIDKSAYEPHLPANHIAETEPETCVDEMEIVGTAVKMIEKKGGLSDES